MGSKVFIQFCLKLSVLFCVLIACFSILPSTVPYYEYTTIYLLFLWISIGLFLVFSYYEWSHYRHLNKNMDCNIIYDS